MAVGCAVALAGAGRNGNGGILKLAAKAFFQLFGQLAHNARAARVVHHQTVTHHLGKAHGTGHGLAFGVDHNHHNVGGAKIYAHIEGFRGADLAGIFPALVKRGDQFIRCGKVHISPLSAAR